MQLTLDRKKNQESIKSGEKPRQTIINECIEDAFQELYPCWKHAGYFSKTYKAALHEVRERDHSKLVSWIYLRWRQICNKKYPNIKINNSSETDRRLKTDQLMENYSVEFPDFNGKEQT